MYVYWVSNDCVSANVERKNEPSWTSDEKRLRDAVEISEKTRIKSFQVKLQLTLTLCSFLLQVCPSISPLRQRLFLQSHLRYVSTRITLSSSKRLFFERLFEILVFLLVAVESAEGFVHLSFTPSQSFLCTKTESDHCFNLLPLCGFASLDAPKFILDLRNVNRKLWTNECWASSGFVNFQ